MANAAVPADLTSSDPSPDWRDADARTERHLRLLAELAELGMTMARAVTARAEEALAEGAEAGDPGLTLSRLARAVRQTLALEAKLAEDRQVRRERQVREHRFQRQAKVRRIVEQAIEADADDSEIDTLLDDLNERLDDRDDTDFTDRPLVELVAAICRDLGVAFDPSLWQDEDRVIEDTTLSSPVGGGGPPEGGLEGEPRRRAPSGKPPPPCCAGSPSPTGGGGGEGP